MSDTLNRPMFKRGPDGQMRQAYQLGGLGTMYKAAKYFAPKFTNVPYNFNQMMTRMGVPTITGKKRVTGMTPPWVGKEGPQAFSPLGHQNYGWKQKMWTEKFDALKAKHGLGNIEASGLKGMKNVPQEVIDHWKTLPKMSWKRAAAEQTGYGLTAGMLNNWMNPPDDPHAAIKQETGSVNEEKLTPSGPSFVDRETGKFSVEGPLVPGTTTPDHTVKGEDEVAGETGDQYDGPTGPSFRDVDTGKFSGMPNLTQEVVASDDSVSPSSIEDYKKELQGVIGKEDKTMGPLLLMQLGLGMMAGKSDQPGFAGFAEILGKTGQEVLPMWMSHMQNKRKEDKEIALAAYDMLREDRAAKQKRQLDLEDFAMKENYKYDQWIQKEQYKSNYAGDESMIQVNTPFTTPSGERIDNWSNHKQTFSKSAEALGIMANGDPNLIRVVNLNMTDAGMKAAGFGDLSLTQSQRGQESLLAQTYKQNLNQVFNFLTDPEIGVHSGNFQTGTAGWIAKTSRFVTRDIQNLFNKAFPGNKTVARANAVMYGMMRSQTEEIMGSLVDSQMGLLAGEGNVATKDHGGQMDVQFGKYMDETGNLREGNFATEQYVRNLMDNQFYDVADQMINMMGFLEARLKQPTGRLLADTIKSSIATLQHDKSLTSGDPRQYANRLHHFVRRLYDAYASHSIKAGIKPETSFGVGRLGQELTVQGYNESYLGFLGPEAVDRGIDLGFMAQFPSTSQNVPAGNAPGNIYPGKQEVIINAPEDFTGLMKYAGGQ